MEHASPKTIAVASVVIFILVKVTQLVNKERKIRSLGGHARRIPTYLPWGMFSVSI
jgi:hypothetical protein